MSFTRFGAAAAALVFTFGSVANAQDPAIRLEAAANAPGKPLVHYWSKVVGAGRANEALRATWQEELTTAHRYAGFEYVRFHGIFHDDMFVYREDKDGKPVYNWQYVDDVFDRMLATGVKPFVELGFVPEELATIPNTTFWWKANGSPPKDNAKWVALVDHVVRHCIERYGQDEVRSWYFEVWNEPNLRYFFKNGTQAQYFELYKVTSLAVKAIDPALRVGGPSTSNFRLDADALAAAQRSGKPFDPLALPWKPVWIADFLEFCKANKLPLDFISTHPYPQNFAIDEPVKPGEPARAAQPGAPMAYRRGIESTHDDLVTLRRMVDASAYPKAEIQLTEWSSSPSGLDHSHDSLAAAAFIAKTNLESVGLVDSLSYWVFTDVFEEARETDSIFHGGFGLINYQQIVKPSFHAYRMMNELGDTTLAAAPGAMVTRASKTGRVAALAYNYPPEVKVSLQKTPSVEEADKIDATGSARPFSLKLTGLRPGASFLVETLDRTHGDAVAAWEQMGRPEPPTRVQTELLRQAAWATAKEYVHADAAGNLRFERSLPAWTLVLVKQLN